MIGLLLGFAVLALLWMALRGFAAASVPTLAALASWVAALGGATLVVLLLLSGRGPVALMALGLAGPLLWEKLRPRGKAGPAPTAMDREEAYQVLGLRPGATEAEIRAAWVRLMRAAHPDHGGSDWLAARVNRARDVLLGT